MSSYNDIEVISNKFQLIKFVKAWFNEKYKDGANSLNFDVKLELKDLIKERLIFPFVHAFIYIESNISSFQVDKLETLWLIITIDLNNGTCEKFSIHLNVDPYICKNVNEQKE